MHLFNLKQKWYFIRLNVLFRVGFNEIYNFERHVHLKPDVEAGGPWDIDDHKKDFEVFIKVVVIDS